MPNVKASDSELGLDNMLRIIPDTWNNISWVVQNSVGELVKQAIENRRLNEQVKLYAIAANVANLTAVKDAEQIAEIDLGRFKKEVEE